MKVATMKNQVFLVGLLVSSIVLSSTPAHAQRRLFTGEVSSYFESYGISGRDSRRPDYTGRVFFRPSLQIYGLSLGAQVWYSTEEERTRQSLNRYSFDPTWKWGSAHVGDFAPSLTRFTLSGLQIRGAQLSLRFPLLRLSVVGGQSQREVLASTVNSALERRLWAVQLGFGKEGRTFLDFTFMRSKDRPGEDIPSVLNPGSAQTQSRLTPQENVVGAVTMGLQLFKGRVSLKGEVAGSLFSQNTESGEPNVAVPQTIRRVFKVRLSSRFDYAYIVESRFDIRPLLFTVGYQYIGPGYASHGLPTLINDRKALIFSGALNLGRGKYVLRANTQLAQDNLTQQKRFETQRDRYTVSFDARPTAKFSSGINIGVNSVANDATSDTFRIEYQALTLDARLSYQLGLWNRRSVLSASYGHHVSQDDNPLRVGSEQTTRQIRGDLSTELSSSLTLSPRVAISTTSRPIIGSYRIVSSGLALSHRSNKFRSNASLNLNQSRGARTLMLMGTSAYQFTRTDAITLNIRLTSLQGKTGILKDYREHLVSLAYSRRF